MRKNFSFLLFLLLSTYFRTFSSAATTAWTEWNSCSRTCDKGLQKRTRSCSSASCKEHLTESRDCLVQQCKCLPDYFQTANWCWKKPTVASPEEDAREHCSKLGASLPFLNSSLTEDEIMKTQEHFLSSSVDEKSLLCMWMDAQKGRRGSNYFWKSSGVRVDKNVWYNWRSVKRKSRRYHCSVACTTVSGGKMDNLNCRYDASVVCVKPHMPAIHGGWASWTELESNCTSAASCLSGSQLRKRSCSNPSPKYGGNFCPGPSALEFSRISMQKPVQGSWTFWSTWTSCSASCGAGRTSRLRTCDSPAPLFGGETCKGDSENTKICNLPACAVDGKWTSWSSWSKCSSSCGDGVKTKKRLCSNPKPSVGGADCVGEKRAYADCALKPCDDGSSKDKAVSRDGAWGSWTLWTFCPTTLSSSCRQLRRRNCDKPPAKGSGKPCRGPHTQLMAARRMQEPWYARWCGWGPWTPCGSACNCSLLTTSRTRVCKVDRTVAGSSCFGAALQSLSCKKRACHESSDLLPPTCTNNPQEKPSRFHWPWWIVYAISLGILFPPLAMCVFHAVYIFTKIELSK